MGPDSVWIVGLGNPGSRYRGTRHSVGFEAVEALAGDLPNELFRKEARLWKSPDRVYCQPLRFMNLSGEVLRNLQQFFKIPLEKIVVLYDDWAIPLGTVRVRGDGSSGGHNGIQNVIDCLGTDRITRVRIGIGPLPEGALPMEYVLEPFKASELELKEQGLAQARSAVDVILEKGLSFAMNQFNRSGAPS